MVRLKRVFLEGFTVGMIYDIFTIRMYLISLLKSSSQENLLRSHTFGEGWNHRFIKRWKLRRRLATTKMRELPADFEGKKAEYIGIVSVIMAGHDIPPELVINFDENAILFVPKAKFTYAVKGAKKVRLVGIGASEKAQITCTLAVTESGDLLKPQLIFQGKTRRSLPGNGASPPDNVLWSFTESHLQTPESCIEYIEEVIVPYKHGVIHQLGLNTNQMTLLKLDLHYSHKDKKVLEIMRLHNLIPLYVPGKCTDNVQECDVVLNDPFKTNVKKFIFLIISELNLNIG